MKNIQYKRAAGLYHSRQQAEAAIQDLRNIGYDMDRVSVIAKDTDQIAGKETTENIANKAEEGAATGAITGGALGGITGLLVGLGALAIPGIGPILLAGAEATAIATTLTGTGIGAAAGSLVGALIGLGIPEEKAKVYSNYVEKGSFLVMATGTLAEVNRAATIMHQHDVKELDIYDIPEAKATTVADVDDDIRSRTDIADEEKIRLYEERLMVNKERAKTGEVAVGKRVKTETASVSVPVEKERIVVECTGVTNGTVINPGKVDFENSEVLRMDVYEESADIEKQAFVREEVSVRKEVERDTVKVREAVRREELKVEADGEVIRQ